MGRMKELAMSEMREDFARAHARSTDRDTSHGAAQSMSTKTELHKRIILGCLGEHGPMTAEEVSNKCSLRYDQVWRRMSDLKNDGLIFDTGERRKNSSGRSAAVMGRYGFVSAR